MPKPSRSMKTTRKTINWALREEAAGAGGVVAGSDMVLFRGGAGRGVLRGCCINRAARDERRQVSPETGGATTSGAAWVARRVPCFRGAGEATRIPCHD